MESSRFDALVRSLASTSRRRTVLRLAGLAIAPVVQDRSEAVAACRRVGGRCDRGSDCCQGARCRGRRCRCKPGWMVCNQDGLCRSLATDPDHCGECNEPCASGCCAGGTCRDLCEDACCAECFAEATGVTDPPKPIPGTDFCCAAAAVCSITGVPKDDLCCWPDEACIDGNCCNNGSEGTVVCGGECCPSVSCCNGKCCAAGQVCARPNPKKPRTCVSAIRPCTDNDDCFGDEVCHGGLCCSGDRVCFVLNQPNNPVCCPLGKYCDPDTQSCCSNGIVCGTTSKKVRIRV